MEEDELEQGANGPGCGAEGEDRWNSTRWTGEDRGETSGLGFSTGI